MYWIKDIKNTYAEWILFSLGLSKDNKEEYDYQLCRLLEGEMGDIDNINDLVGYIMKSSGISYLRTLDVVECLIWNTKHLVN